MYPYHLILFHFIALYQARGRDLYERYLRATPVPPPATETARTREAYIETISSCALISVASTLVLIALEQLLGWQADLSFLGLPAHIPWYFLSLSIFSVLLLYAFYGHLIGSAIRVALSYPVQIAARLLADLVTQFRPGYLTMQPAVLRRNTYTLRPPPWIPRSGLPFLLFATTSSLRIP